MTFAVRLDPFTICVNKTSILQAPVLRKPAHRQRPTNNNAAFVGCTTYGSLHLGEDTTFDVVNSVTCINSGGNFFCQPDAAQSLLTTIGCDDITTVTSSYDYSTTFTYSPDPESSYSCTWDPYWSGT